MIMMKRSMDVLVASAALLALAPVMAVVTFLVRLRIGSPVLFRQSRPGLHGELFEIVKFRTMADEYDASGTLLSDEQRLTRFGKNLRSTSLDELPELINVLRGEMSIVGPRPLLEQYLPLYSQHQARRHEVRPGVTGWAQVNGRNSLSWDEKFNLDVWYVDNMSTWLDMKIIGKTVRSVVSRSGIGADGTPTPHPFTGNQRLVAVPDGPAPTDDRMPT